MLIVVLLTPGLTSFSPSKPCFLIKPFLYLLFLNETMPTVTVLNKAMHIFGGFELNHIFSYLF